MPGFVRHRAHDDGERRLPRESRRGRAGCDARRAVGAARRGACAMTGQRVFMTFDVTADVAHAGRLPGAGRLLGADEGADADAARPGDQGSERVRAPGARRRGVPGGTQVGRGEAQRRPAALPVHERRRGRARHVQGSLAAGARAAPAAGRHAHRRLRPAEPPHVHLHPRRVRPGVPAAGRGAGGGVRGRPLRREHPGHGLLLRPRDLPRGRVVRVRRGLGDADVAGREEGLSAQSPAATDRGRPVPEAHGREQRGDASPTCRTS